MVAFKRDLAFFALAWTVAAASMAGFAISPPANSATIGNEDGVVLEDVQFGERGNQSRIAFLCDGVCGLGKRSPTEFILLGVSASLSVDLSESSYRISGLNIQQESEGAAVSIKTASPLNYSDIKNCSVGGRAAICLDLFFDFDGAADSASAASVDRPVEQAQESETTRQAANNNQEIKPPKPISREAQANVAPGPALREGEPGRLTKFSNLASPERLEPPVGAILAKVQPIESSVEVRRPAIRQDPPLPIPAGADYGAQIKVILGKELTSPYCNNAEATLQADAWALGSMVDVGLCAAARGDLTEADEVLQRLLDYTPDNYEALVGRALIAERAGEKGVARKFYQDALNALPPIEESGRIVDAMASIQ